MKTKNSPQRHGGEPQTQKIKDPQITQITQITLLELRKRHEKTMRLANMFVYLADVNRA
jgi:hypothetical protein